MTEPTLSEVFRVVLDSRLEEVHTMLPGVVVSYDPKNETCSVQPGVRVMVPTEVETEYVAETIGVVHDVPVQFPRGGGSYIKWRLAKGDGVALVFSEADAGRWRSTGKTSDPESLGRHTLSHPIALAGWAVGGDVGAQVPADTLVVEAPTEIHLGEGASDFVALAGLVETAVANAIAGHTHPGVLTGTASTGSGVATGPVGSTAASKVKAE